MKICHVVGARPQFVKYLPLNLATKKLNRECAADLVDVLVHTGQHYDYNMSRLFFDELGIKLPDYNLGAGGKLQAVQTAEVLVKCDEVFNKEDPDVVVVYGDTNSTIGAALAAVKLHIPVAHVEAGLRSFNKFMPEEINRIVVDHTSTLLFCPSQSATQQLQNEGFRRVLDNGKLMSLDYKFSDQSMIDKNNPMIVNTGDIMYDVMEHALKMAQSQSSIIADLALGDINFTLLTIHRAENTDHAEALKRVAEYVTDITSGGQVICPMHPRTAKACERHGVQFGSNVRIIDPVSYFDLLMLLESASGVLTDSGGLQKEAFWMKTPCITLREETEWIETIDSGWNVLFGTADCWPNAPEFVPSVYGDGNAAERMLHLLQLLPEHR
ncbi:UDP-N-acetyl glucosamine 2-epimerase [bacterium]|nr:UDP-N-acetyl glucosamine 2-epimerase [bacterium]